MHFCFTPNSRRIAASRRTDAKGQEQTFRSSLGLVESVLVHNYPRHNDDNAPAND